MRIVCVSDSRIPSSSANSVQVMKMCQSFAKNGHSVVLLARRGEAATAEDCEIYGVQRNFELRKLPWPKFKGGGFIYAWHCSRYVAGIPRPDLVYSRTIYGSLATFRQSLSVIHESHTPPRNWQHSTMQRTLFRSARFRHLVVITRALEQEYLKLFPWLAEGRTLVAHDAADMPSDSTPSYRPIRHWPGRRELPQIGYVGQLYPGKGMGLIGRLAFRMPDFDFHVVGGSRSEIGHWRKTLPARNLHFHGHVPHSQVFRYLKSFDVLLAPYQRRVEAASGTSDIAPWMSPLKIFEYMAAGRAIVCSDLPVLREVLEDRVNALLVPPDNTESWSVALKKLRDEPALARALGGRAQDLVTARYNWDYRAERVVAPIARTADVEALDERL